MKILQRIYGSKDYIKYLDGIRCVSIFAVIYHHFVRYYIVKDKMVEGSKLEFIGMDLFDLYASSIYMFFSITGFIIGLMFVKSYTETGRGINLKKYYFRRLTRMEPPYLILLTVFFLLNLYSQEKGGFSDLVSNFLASFFYVHNILFDPLLPVINGVLWTFELQIQFYILAPLFAMIFKLPVHIRRVVFLVLTLFLSSAVNYIFHFEFRNIFQYIHYFILGFLIADIYYNYKGKIKSSLIFDFISLVCLYFAFAGGENMYWRLLLFTGIILSTEFSIYVRRFLELKWIVIIGGMSYSVYMLHQRVMFLFLNNFYFDKILWDNFYIDFVLKFIVTIFVILLCSALFFIFVERPTMKREWWKYRNLKKLFLE
ncbi:MAG TPA: acyltransferase [Moheibacter sp.]|nr:acyltransferase [Moheibacter sp.]